jgi:uncharacterized protein involved in outer membrane biogenesis
MAAGRALPRPARLALWVLAGLAALVVLLALVLVLFPWNVLRGPIERHVTETTGRAFRLGGLDVQLGRTTRVVLEDLSFANPDWAVDRHLVEARRAEVDVRLLPLLLHRRIELPRVRLSGPRFGLQAEADGRRTWSLGGDTRDDANVPAIGQLLVDQGEAHYVAAAQGANIRLRFALAPQDARGAGGPPLPLRFEAAGRWQSQPFEAKGRTGDVLALSGSELQQPFPAQVELSAGGTRLRAAGRVASLATLEGTQADVRLEGPNLGELYRLVGVALPDTPRYAVAARVSQQGGRWQFAGIDGRLGRSDFAGDLAYAAVEGRRPVLTGALRSRLLDFEDLAPVIGLGDEAPRGRTRAGAAAPRPQAGATPAKAPKVAARKVLPDTPLDLAKLRSLDADVQLDAARVVNAKGLPLERIRTRVQLQDGVLGLDPLDLGVAGGRLAGRLRVDGSGPQPQARLRLDARALELARLLPAVESSRNSFGRLQGEVELAGRGTSVAQLLGGADGHLALLMGQGQISNLLLELAGLDGGEILKFFLGGDRRVPVRCAAVSFDVARGVASSRALLLDTTDTVFVGDARIDLGRETLDVLVKPQPKDASILSLRTPLKIGGTFRKPEGGLQASGLAGRAAAAVALGAINPLLALAATVETGPGRDADCVGTLRQAAAPQAEARVNGSGAPPAAAAAPAATDGARAMGGPAAAASTRSPAPPQEAQMPQPR